jgi:hypothetical protein
MTMRLPLLPLAILILAFVGCATPNRGDAWREGTTIIKATGTPGSQITGFYVQDGRRHEIASALPFTLTERGLSEAEIRKVIGDEALTVEVRYDAPERQATFANMVAAPGVPGVRIQFRNGFVVENLRK